MPFYIAALIPKCSSETLQFPIPVRGFVKIISVLISITCLWQHRFQLEVTPLSIGKPLGIYLQRQNIKPSSETEIISEGKGTAHSNRMIQSNIINVKISKLPVFRDVGTTIH
jgi:hypothetical protein